jgi:hypothetical protein
MDEPGFLKETIAKETKKGEEYLPAGYFTGLLILKIF